MRLGFSIDSFELKGAYSCYKFKGYSFDIIIAIYNLDWLH